MKAIACVDKNMGIGKDNKLLVSFKEDMKFFKETTIGHTVIMGTNTFLSMKKPLKDRKNIVVSKNLRQEDYTDVIVCNNYKELLDIDDAYVIGGGQIYKLFLPYCDEIILTEVNEDYGADTFFPYFDKSLYKVEILKETDDFVIKRYKKG